MKLNKIFVLIFIIVLSGCATIQPPVGADFGPPPEYAPQILKGYVVAHLKDPDSLKDWRVNGPYKCWRGYAFNDVLTGWCVDFFYRAKNSYGAYVPSSNRRVYKNGKLIDIAYAHLWKPL